MIKVLIFDMDGTLADTIESVRAALNFALRKYGCPEKSYDDIREHIGGGAKDLIRLTLPPEKSGDAELSRKVFECYFSEYEKTYVQADRCYPGVYEAVTELARRGRKIAVCSNKTDCFVKSLSGILFPGGEVSFSVGQGVYPSKPDPTAPLVIAGMFGVSPEECAFIGDSDTDMLTAKNAGMLAVGCSWGYRSVEVLREAGADVIVDDAAQLLELLG